MYIILLKYANIIESLVRKLLILKLIIEVCKIQFIINNDQGYIKFKNKSLYI